jgi:AcrR family transcriptional regulator
VNAASSVPAQASGDGRAERWSAHRTSRRKELVRAARHAIHRMGPDASMEEIAAAAGTSKPVFYRYFGDKSGLQRAVGEAVAERMQAKLQAAAEIASTEHDGLRAMVDVYLQMAESSPNVYAFVTRGAGPDTAAVQGAMPVHFFSAVTAMIEAPLRHHLESRGRAGIDLAAASFWPPAAIGMVRAAGERWLRTPPGPDKPGREAMTEQITGWLWAGIAGPATRNNR